jgi:orotate phosphoribosyltransferase
MIDDPPTFVLLDELSQRGAVIHGSHVVYASGAHGTSYINKDAIYPDPAFMMILGAALVRPFCGEGIAAVVGPALGGIVLAQYAAFALMPSLGDCCEALYAEKDGKDGFVLRRGYDLRVKGREVLVVEDVLTTGASARKVVDAVRAAGGTVAGVAALVNRGGVTAEALGVPRLHALLDISLDSWTESECPLCAQGVPVNTAVGHGNLFLARKKGLVTLR